MIEKDTLDFNGAEHYKFGVAEAQHDFVEALKELQAKIEESQMIAGEAVDKIKSLLEKYHA